MQPDKSIQMYTNVANAHGTQNMWTIWHEVGRAKPSTNCQQVKVSVSLLVKCVCPVETFCGTRSSSLLHSFSDLSGKASHKIRFHVLGSKKREEGFRMDASEPRTWSDHEFPPRLEPRRLRSGKKLKKGKPTSLEDWLPRSAGGFIFKGFIWSRTQAEQFSFSRWINVLESYVSSLIGVTCWGLSSPWLMDSLIKALDSLDAHGWSSWVFWWSSGFGATNSNLGYGCSLFSKGRWIRNRPLESEFNSCRCLSILPRDMQLQVPFWKALWEAFFCDISSEKSGYIKGACHVKRALSKTHQRQDFSAFEASSAPHWLDIADSRAKKRLQLTRAKRVKHDCWNFLCLIIINDNNIWR